MTTEPRPLCEATLKGRQCVFFKGHRGPHRVIPKKTSSGGTIRWYDFFAILLVGCGGADFSSAALEITTDAQAQEDRFDAAQSERLESSSELGNHPEGSSGASGEGGEGSDSPVVCSPTTSCQAQGYSCGQVFDGCEEVTCPTPFNVYGYSSDCVNAGLPSVLYLCGGDHSAPAPNDTCTLLPHIVGSTMWCCVE